MPEPAQTSASFDFDTDTPTVRLPFSPETLVPSFILSDAALDEFDQPTTLRGLVESSFPDSFILPGPRVVDAIATPIQDSRLSEASTELTVLTNVFDDDSLSDAGSDVSFLTNPYAYDTSTTYVVSTVSECPIPEKHQIEGLDFEVVSLDEYLEMLKKNDAQTSRARFMSWLITSRGRDFVPSGSTPSPTNS